MAYGSTKGSRYASVPKSAAIAAVDGRTISTSKRSIRRGCGGITTCLIERPRNASSGGRAAEYRRESGRTKGVAGRGRGGGRGGRPAGPNKGTDTRHSQARERGRISLSERTFA